MDDAPSEDAYEAWDRSLERLVLIDEPMYTQIRAAFAAGYSAGLAARSDQEAQPLVS